MRRSNPLFHPSPSARARPRRGSAALLLSALAVLSLLLGGCGDATGPGDPFAGEVAVVVNSVDLTLTLFPIDSVEETRTVGLGPDGTPVGLSVRGDRAVVPMGTVPALVVVDVRAGEVDRTLALPEGSGATGSAFWDDALVLVANPGLNTVSRINVETGVSRAEIDVGTNPQEVVVVGERAFVMNAGAFDPDTFEPTDPGTITVVDPDAGAPVITTITLSGRNPGGAAVGPDGLLYVVNSGAFGQGDGSVSVVDPVTLQEVAHHTGFGDFPFSVAFDAAGLLHVASFSYGIAVWDPGTETFVRAPGDAVTPGGVPSVSGVGADGAGRIWALTPECSAPGRAHRLAPDRSVEESATVGICPVAIDFVR